jgi:hypothetical protein
MTAFLIKVEYYATALTGAMKAQSPRLCCLGDLKSTVPFEGKTPAYG